ncbi:P-loop containing nucleoside triphosphate hydrolase protein [Mycena metata]|uniref:DNA 3'-5' helicase n=1 Tax=Mycena metata TaxID=1033252 RepID=A0AAD7MTV8_9AGAR|nr:P-loop containing nucleoside triphosphate hydrolase protein [Mycena metata]
MPPPKKPPRKPKLHAAQGSRQPLTQEQLRGLPEKMQKKFNWKHVVRAYQLEGIEAQLLMRDCLVHAGTGMGKTTVVAGPHAHESSAGKTTLLISPLIALQDEQVNTFREEFGLKAIAVNSGNGGCTPEVLQREFQEIVRGEHQIVILSPEMALSRRFIHDVLKNAEFARRLLSVVVDEAHVVSHWGASFRKKYGTLGTIRAFLPRGTPMVALSATLPARVRGDVLSKLQFSKDYVNIDVGNDRPNVSIIIRGIHYPLNTYADLDFLVAGVKSRSDLKKIFIYADNIATGVEIIDHLTSLLPPELRDAIQGYDTPIRPYNAALSKEYRKRAMEKFREGTVRILVCTDAAGMGCNIPDIDIVVQWKLPASVSIFVQRAGRAARAHGRTGIAILLVEPSAYTVDLKAELEKEHAPRGKKKVAPKGEESEAEKRKKAQDKKLYAKSRGVDRGAAGGKHDAILVADTPPLDPEATNEGLYVLIQTGTCRRAILTTIYNNKPAVSTVACCDICCPELLDLTRPGKPPKVARQSAIKRGEVNMDLQVTLNRWRTNIKARDYPSPLFASSAILRDETIALLASVGPINSVQHLKKILSGQWTWWDKYGEELYACLEGQLIPAMVPLPKKTRGTKRQREEGDAVTSNRPALTITAMASMASTPIASGSKATRGRRRTIAQTPEQIRASFEPNPAATALWSSFSRTPGPQTTPQTPQNDFPSGSTSSGNQS